MTDWKLDNFYTADPTGFDEYLQGFLVLGIPTFETFCDQSLDRNDTTALFTEDLTDDNVNILSLTMLVAWMQKEKNDIRQMSLHISDKDFKTYSEANNLRAKNENYIIAKEELSQLIIDYTWQRADFTSWVSGDFGV